MGHRWTGSICLAAVLAVGGCSSGEPEPSSGGASGPASPVTLPSAPQSDGPVTILIDTDVAPDDLAAIAFLVAAPDVTIAAVTVSGTGEAHCTEGVDVVLRLLERLKAPDIPVGCGREKPLVGDHAFPDTWREHADAGSGLELPATNREPAAATAADLIRTAAAEHETLVILTLGPMTNLADALSEAAGLAGAVDSLVVMGGAIDVPGNVAGSDPSAPDNEAAEWNIYCDPTAAAMVVDSGLAVRWVSLDGTNQVPVTADFAELVQAASAERDAAGIDLLADLFAANPYMTSGGYYLWDPLAAMIAAGYPVGTFTAVAVDVDEGEGPTSGATRRVEGDLNGEFLSEAIAADAEATLVGVLAAE